jgi:hypothetical protein
MMLGSSGYVGMMEWDPESVYDVLAMTPENIDFESIFEGSYHPLRECNMLHLSEDRAMAIEGVEDDTYPIPCTPRGQAEYDQEHLEQTKAREAEPANERRDNGCPSLQHLNAEGVWARHVYDQIQQGKRETPVFPRASQNVAATAMIMRMAPKPSINEGKRIH